MLEAKRALREAARFGDLATLVLVDLDNFKQVNDIRGHKPAPTSCARSACATSPTTIR